MECFSPLARNAAPKLDEILFKVVHKCFKISMQIIMINIPSILEVEKIGNEKENEKL